MKVWISLLLLLSFQLSGCFRYSFTGTVPPHLKTVAIPTLEDRTSEFGLRESLTDALIGSYRKDNTLRVVDVARADAVVSGEILSVSEAPYTFTASETITEYRVTVNVNVRFEDKVKAKVIFEAPISAWGTYNFANEGTAGRQKAVDAAVQKLADDIVAKTLSGW